MSTAEYTTIAAAAEGLYRAKGSKFYGFAYPVETEEEAVASAKALREQHHKARHWCYAYRLGLGEDRWRANDDGEPSGTAGRPILGQIDSRGLTGVVVVVVRYYGGVKLGVPGLIEAYRTAAAEALDAGETVRRVLRKRLTIETDYTRLAHLMSSVKAGPWEQVANDMTDRVRLTIAARADEFDEAFVALWLRLAEAYPGEERLDEDPEGYFVDRADA